MKTNVIIKECNLNIYPRYIWVAYDENTIPIIKENFTYQNGDNIEEVGKSKGEVHNVMAKNNKDKVGVLVYLSDTSSHVLVHESVHAALLIMDSINMDLEYMNQEPFAYLVEYIYKILCNAISSEKEYNLYIKTIKF